MTRGQIELLGVLIGQALDSDKFCEDVNELNINCGDHGSNKKLAEYMQHTFCYLPDSYPNGLTAVLDDIVF